MRPRLGVSCRSCHAPSRSTGTSLQPTGPECNGYIDEFLSRLFPLESGPSVVVTDLELTGSYGGFGGLGSAPSHPGALVNDTVIAAARRPPFLKMFEPSSQRGSARSTSPYGSDEHRSAEESEQKASICRLSGLRARARAKASACCAPSVTCASANQGCQADESFSVERR